MDRLTRFLDVIDRAYSGPMVEEEDFDLKMVAAGVQRVLQEYDLKFDKGHIIQQDDALIDRTFEAGLDFLVECGVYNRSTGRLIKFNRQEIMDTIEAAPTKVVIGEGQDARLYRSRKVEDPTPPQVSGGPIGTPLSEDQYITIMQSYWREPILDLLVPGTLSTTYGRQLRAKSPLEIAASWQESAFGNEAARRAGRPGLSRMCVEMSISDIGHLSSISRGGFKPTDVHVIPMIGEMKTNHELLNKVAHSIHQNGVILGFYNPILGGLAGPEEGVAVLIIAGWIALHMLYMPDSVESCPTHPFSFNSTAPQILRAVSVAAAAFARNTHLLTEFMTSPVSGPGTESLLYECTAMATVASACGASRVLGVRSAVGVVENHCTGLETRFNGEVAHAAAGLSRSQADEIVKRAVSAYLPQVESKPVGLPFNDVYDLQTVQPKQAWLDVYNKVKEQVSDWKLPLG
ncbi:MAG: monomethylamine:corrinoid methyltransferase [Anaerolineae bacterium]|nr:monomethylamine:corrinoid methyltransferase [Anaerolineae bacterium]